ncbi:MAG: hypothetical protein ACNA8W_14605 [Bradymonadaceae bacterium]
MKYRILMTTAAAALTMTTILWSAPAAACSILCSDDVFTPTGGTVPANVNGAVWKPTYFADAQAMDEGDIRLIHVGTGDEISFNLIANSTQEMFWLEFHDLEAGEEYRFEAPWSCEPEGSPSEWTFEVGPAAPFPTDTLSLSASEPVRENLRLFAGAQCYADVHSVYVDVELAIPAELEPWRDALIFETLVDGNPWRVTPFDASIYSLTAIPPGETWQGRGKDRIYAVCETSDGIPQEMGQEGTFTVSMRAWIPGRTAVLVSNEVEIELRCEESAENSGGCACASMKSKPMPAGFLLTALFCGLAVAFRRRSAN